MYTSHGWFVSKLALPLPTSANDHDADANDAEQVEAVGQEASSGRVVVVPTGQHANNAAVEQVQLGRKMRAMELGGGNSGGSPGNNNGAGEAGQPTAAPFLTAEMFQGTGAFPYNRSCARI